MINLGPFSTPTVIVMLALMLAWLLARHIAKRHANAPHKEAGALVLDAAFWGFLSARVAYIALWWEEYAARPWSVFAFGDGGFLWWVGLPAALLYLWRKTRFSTKLRRPVLTGVAAGVVLWALANSLLTVLLRTAAPLPDVQVLTLDERPLSLSAAYAGRPVVLNLWASWCPPCRREMPVFERAQHAFPGIAFAMVNQGESAQQAIDFLKSEGLNLTDVLLDPASRTMQAVQSRGLPTTLFFDAEGRLVEAHFGEITMASLTDKVSRRLAQAPAPNPNKE
ncbi:MAG: TlpA disulfide reductase family protein [Pigmentiphaga sp.]